MKQFSVSFSQIDDAPVDRVDADNSIVVSLFFGYFIRTTPTVFILAKLN